MAVAPKAQPRAAPAQWAPLRAAISPKQVGLALGARAPPPGSSVHGPGPNNGQFLQPEGLVKTPHETITVSHEHTLFLQAVVLSSCCHSK